MPAQLPPRRAFERSLRTARIAPCHPAFDEPRAWIYRGLGFLAGPYLCLPSVKRSIGEPFPDNTLQRALGALGVIYAEFDAIAMAEIELCDIAMQMLLGAMLVNAFHAALENAVVSLSRIDTDL